MRRDNVRAAKSCGSPPAPLPSASARDNQGAALDTENVSRAPTCTTPRRGNEGRAPLTPTDGNGTVRRRASASTPIERRHLFRDRYGSALEGCGPASVREGHPVYGQLLHDSGFKRVYATSAKRLVENVPVWHRQRPVNAARVKVRRSRQPLTCRPVS